MQWVVCCGSPSEPSSSRPSGTLENSLIVFANQAPLYIVLSSVLQNVHECQHGLHNVQVHIEVHSTYIHCMLVHVPQNDSSTLSLHLLHNNVYTVFLNEHVKTLSMKPCLT